MTRQTTETAALRYVDALLGDGFADLPMTDDVTFRGPRLGPIVGEAEVRAVLAGVAKAFSRFTILRGPHLVDGSSAFVVLDVSLPDGRGFEIADYLVFRGEELASVRAYFDAGVLEDLGAAPSVRDLGPSARL